MGSLFPTSNVSSGESLGLDFNPWDSVEFQLFSGAVTGGVGSVIGGGNFFVGAATGLAVTYFNHLMHKINFGSDEIKKTKLYKYLKANGIEGLDLASAETIDKLNVAFKDLYYDKSSKYVVFANEENIKEYQGYKAPTIVDNHLYSFGITAVEGLTDSVGNVYLSSDLIGNTVFNLAEIYIHELTHSFHHMSELYNQWGRFGGGKFASDMTEALSYSETYKWTGYMADEGFLRISNVLSFFNSLR